MNGGGSNGMFNMGGNSYGGNGMMMNNNAGGGGNANYNGGNNNFNQNNGNNFGNGFSNYQNSGQMHGGNMASGAGGFNNNNNMNPNNFNNFNNMNGGGMGMNNMGNAMTFNNNGGNNMNHNGGMNNMGGGNMGNNMNSMQMGNNMNGPRRMARMVCFNVDDYGFCTKLGCNFQHPNGGYFPGQNIHHPQVQQYMRELLGCNQATEYNNNNNYNGGGAIMNNCNGPRSSKSEGGGASGDNSSSFRGADVQNSGRVINYDAPPAGQGQQGSSSNNPAAKRQRNDSRERPQEQQPGGGRIVPFGQQHGAPVTLSDVESWVKTEITKALEEISDPPKYVVEGGELLVTQAEANGCKEVMKDLDLKNIAKKLPQTVLAELLQLNPISGPIQRNIQMLKNLIGKAAKSVFKYWNRGDVANTISAAIGFRQNGDANGTIAVMSILFLKKMQKENHPDIVNAE